MDLISSSSLKTGLGFRVPGTRRNDICIHIRERQIYECKSMGVLTCSIRVSKGRERGEWEG